MLVAEIQAGGIENASSIGRGAGRTNVLREQIEQPSIESLLFGRVVVVLVGSYRLRSIQTKGIGRSISVGRIQVRIVVQEGVGESVDAWCAWFRHEAWFPPGIRCIGVGSEVVIKGDVFLEDNDQV